MRYIASLDLGSDWFRMALAERTDEEIRLLGVESAASQGFLRGELTDPLRVKALLRELLGRLEQESGLRPEEMHVALPAGWLSQTEVRDTLSSSREQPGMRIVARVPLPEAGARLYAAPERELERLEEILRALGIEEIRFFTGGEALTATLSPREGYADCALIDLGAESVTVAVAMDGKRIYEAELPLGGSSIDSDLDHAFSIHDRERAKRLKEEYGQALLAACKAQPVIIPGTNFSIERQNLVLVQQARLEELLEGAVWQMLRSGYYTDLTGGIFLAGGGSRINGLQTLVRKLSGHEVRAIRITGRISGKGAWLQPPEHVKVLGLLCCGESGGGSRRTLFWERLGSLFKPGK